MDHGSGRGDHRVDGRRSSPPASSDGDTIIDGGNSYYRDDIRRAAELAAQGIRYVDCGTSGGVFGLERGFCLMVGGPDDAFAELEPIFASLAPGVEAAERTPGRDGEPDAARSADISTAGRRAQATS